MPGVRDVVFRRLGETGRHQASHFSRAGRWYTIAELSDPTGPFRLDFLRSRQLSHFLHSLKPPADSDQPLKTLEEICNTSGTMAHSLSLAYGLLNTPHADFIPPDLLKWERELNCHFNTTKCQHILRFTHKSSICTKIQETNYKLLSRWYRTPVKLHEFFPETLDLCWRCGTDRGTLTHIFCSCPVLDHFWRMVHKVTQRFTERTIPDDPAFFLLHASNIPEKAYKTSVIRHLVDAAKACIPLQWKSTCPPTISSWLTKIEEIRHMEDLILTAQNRQEVFTKTWQMWTMFIFSNEGQALRKPNGAV